MRFLLPTLANNVFLSKKKESFSCLSQEGSSLHIQFKTLSNFFVRIASSLSSSVSKASARWSIDRRFESGMIHQYFFAMFPYFTQYLAIEITFGAQFPSRFTSQPACQKSAVFGHFHNCWFALHKGEGEAIWLSFNDEVKIATLIWVLAIVIDPRLS